MSQQIADLVVDLTVDSVAFKEQMGRVERHLKQNAERADASARRLDHLAQQQAESIKNSTASAAKTLQQLDRQQEHVIERYVREYRNAEREVIAIQQRAAKMAQQNQAKSLADSARKQQQDAATEAYFRQLDSIKKLGGGLEALRALRSRLHREAQAGIVSNRDYLTLLSQITSQTGALKREEATLAQERSRFIQTLRQKAEAVGKSRTEMLELKAAQLGVTQQATPLINKLKEMGKETGNLSGKGRSAMNMLKNLASTIGMGGLLRGGGVGTVVTVLGSAAKIAYTAEKEFTEFNKQLILTGNYANKTAGQLNEMARVMAGNGITRSEMAASIASVVGTGLFSDNEISRIAKSAAQMNYITGQSVDTTINQFKRLQDEPLKMSLELEKANHHLTAAQLEQIRTLELQGNTTAAARVAIDAYAQSINDGANDITQNLGYLETAWVAVEKAVKGAKEAMLDFGRDKSIGQQIRKYEEKLIEFQINPASKGIHFYKTGISPEDIKRELDKLKEEKYHIDMEKEQDQVKKRAEQAEIEKFRIQQKWHNNYASWKTKRDEELAKLEAEKYALTQEKYEEYKGQINYKWRDRQMPGSGKGSKYQVDAGTREDEKAARDLLSLQSQLEVLKGHQSVDDVISQQRKDLWKEQAQFNILEEVARTRKLTLDEKSLLSSKESILAQKEKLAIIGDEIAFQERLNRLQDQADKYTSQQQAKRDAIEANLGKSSCEAQRGLERAQLLSGHKNNPRLNDMLAEQQKTFEMEDQKRANWLAGAQTAWANYRDTAIDVNSQVQNATSAALNGFSSQLTNVLVESEANFKEFTRSILKMLTDIFVKMSIVKGIEVMGFGGVTLNAKGNVYTSPSLSAYSGQIVNRPTMFAFAHGAGVMGEAGPEGIFPLRRGADGKLGVVAKLSGRDTGFVQQNHITINNDGSNGQIGPQALKLVYEMSKKGARDYFLNERRDGGAL